MLHYLQVGGPILWVLTIISIAAFAVILERIAFFSRNEKPVGNTFKEEILSLVANKKIDEARNLCASKKSCVTAAVKKFLEKAEIIKSHKDLGFDAEVMKAIKKWKFKPIFHKGKNIKVYFVKTFVFEPQ